jgi:hypothetical protein
MRQAGHVAQMRDMRNVCNSLVGKPEGKRSLGRLRHRWEYNIGMDLMEIRWKGVDWMYLAEDRNQWQAFVNTEMNLNIP